MLAVNLLPDFHSFDCEHFNPFMHDNRLPPPFRSIWVIKLFHSCTFLHIACHGVAWGGKRKIKLLLMALVVACEKFSIDDGKRCGNLMK
jgi:hypothetical protein